MSLWISLFLWTVLTFVIILGGGAGGGKLGEVTLTTTFCFCFIGLTGGGQDNNLLYLSGIPHTKVPSSEIIDKVVKLVEEKVKEKK